MGRPLEEDEGGFGDGGESSGREMSLLEFLAEGMDKATQVQTHSLTTELAIRPKKKSSV